ncbi:MAG: PDGLE domain-containing protein [Nocardioidaceae bacterium]
MKRVSTRSLIVAGVLVALVLAGIVSYYASSDPDGLNKVAADKGFSSAEKTHVSTDSPLAGYETKGVHNSRLSGGLAGVAGSVVVLVLAGGVALVLRRHRDPTEAQ